MDVGFAFSTHVLTDALQCDDQLTSVRPLTDLRCIPNFAIHFEDIVKRRRNAEKETGSIGRCLTLDVRCVYGDKATVTFRQ
jgi:hypothetical protein